MPMPHRTQMQIIKRRLVGKEGRDRINALKAVLNQLPGYRSGPYADIRKWVTQEIERTRVRSRVVQRDSIAVRRQGAAQIALVGAPNAGKSSLLRAVSDIQARVGDYAFTTLRPLAAVTRIKEVPIQLVEIPGLLQGASQGRAKGRALLGVLREADGIVYCHDVGSSIDQLTQILGEVAVAGIVKPSIVAVTKVDEAAESVVERIVAATPDLQVIGVSVLDEASLEAFQDAVWRMTGLLRVFTRHLNETAANPLALSSGSTVRDVAEALHKELAAEIRAARIWGPSARFPGQQVGRDHEVKDGDVVEILT